MGAMECAYRVGHRPTISTVIRRVYDPVVSPGFEKIDIFRDVNVRPLRSVLDESRTANLSIALHGLTRPCLRQATSIIADRFDCLAFHAMSVGGRSMENVLQAGMRSVANSEQRKY